MVEKAPSIHKKNSHASPTPLVREGAVALSTSAHWNRSPAARRRQAGLGLYRTGLSPAAWRWRFAGFYRMANSSLSVTAASSRSWPQSTRKPASKSPDEDISLVEAQIVASFVTPTIAVVDGKPQVMAPGPNDFAAYDLATGAELWKVLAPGWSVVPQPTVAHGLVIYNHDYDNPELIAIRLGGQGDVNQSRVAWRVKRRAPGTPSPVLVGEELYFVSDDRNRLLHQRQSRREILDGTDWRQLFCPRPSSSTDAFCCSMNRVWRPG